MSVSKNRTINFALISWEFYSKFHLVPLRYEIQEMEFRIDQVWVQVNPF